jgi:Tol biopolymer transport system component
MAPEQLEGRKVDRRADVWALGCVLYEMLTQRTPFEADYEQAIGYGILNEDPEPVTALRKGLPPRVDDLLAKALAKNPAERYQHVADLAVDLKQLKTSSARSAKTKQSSIVKRTSWGVRVAAGLALVALAALLSWLLLERPGEQSVRLENMRLRHITTDNGLAMHPTISPSGEFVVYASDRAGEGHLDLWLQQIGGGAPVRLTSDPGDEMQPAFSPDGRQIAFRSNKDGGGIYVMPALGGSPRFLAASGRRPRFSPDGELIAYWTGEEHFVVNNTVHVISATGGEPLDLFAGKYPVWSPEGSRILFVSDRDNTAKVRRNWLIGDPTTRDIVRVGAREMLLEEGLNGEPVDGGLPFIPSSWAENGEVLFSARLGDSWNIWALGLTRNGSIEGRARRVTTGGGYDRFAFSAPGGRIVFTSGAPNQDIWSLPVDANLAEMTGPPQRLTSASTDEAQPHISADGEILVFTTYRAGQSDLWVMDLRDGKSSPFTVSPASESKGLTNENGSVLFYTHRDTDGGEPVVTIYTAPRGGGQRHEICTDCGNSAALSPDGMTFVSYKLEGTQVCDRSDG